MYLMSAIFGIKVKINDGIVTVTNIPAKVIEGDIRKIYKTTRIGINMLNTIGRNSFSFNEFFALEMYKILSAMSKERSVKTNVKMVREIAEEIKANTWINRISDLSVRGRLDFTKLNELTMAPLSFQMEFLRTYDTTIDRYNLNGMLLSAVAGSGKTYTSLAVGACLNAERIVVLCPKTAIDRVWVETVGRIYKKPPSIWTSASDSDYNGEFVAVYHYEAIGKALENIPLLRSGKTLLIVDESHNLNEISSIRTQRMIELGNKLFDGLNSLSKNVILMSGTPVKALSLELIPLFRMIDPLFTESTESRYKAIYKGKVTLATELLAYRLNAISFKVEKKELNLDEPVFKEIKINIGSKGNIFTLDNISLDLEDYARERIRYYDHMYGEYKDIYESCLNMAMKVVLSPDKPRKVLMQNRAEYEEYRDNVKKVKAAHDHGRLYDMTDEMAQCTKYERNIILPNLPTKELKDKFKDAKSVIKYVKLKIRGECLGRVLGRKRIEASIAVVPYIDFEGIINSTLKKTVIFSSYIEVIDEAVARCKELGFNPVSVAGDTTKQLSSIVQRFETYESINPLIASYASLSTAVPLVMADTMILINLPFRGYVLDQTISRINRLGADTQTYVYIINLDTGDKPNITSRNIDILKWSQDQVEQILKIKSPFKIETDDEENYNEVAVECIDELMIPKMRRIEPDRTRNIKPGWVDW